MPVAATDTPTLHAAPREAGHGPGHVGDTLLVKAGGRHAPLAAPAVALAGQQPLAERRLEGIAGEPSLRVVAVILEENVLDEARLVHENEVAEEHALRPEVCSERIAVEHGDRVLADQPQPLRQVDRTRRRLGNHARLAGDRRIERHHRFQWYGIPRASTGIVESVIE